MVEIERSAGARRWFVPIATALLGIGILWTADRLNVRARESERAKVLDQRLFLARHELETSIDRLASEIDILAVTIQSSGQLEETDFAILAGSLAERRPCLWALTYANPGGGKVYRYPADSRDMRTGRETGPDRAPPGDPAARRIVRQHWLVNDDAGLRMQSGYGLEVGSAPDREGGPRAGRLVAVFDMARLIDGALARFGRDRFGYRIEDAGGVVVYASGAMRRAGARKNVRIGDRIWRVHVDGDGRFEDYYRRERVIVWTAGLILLTGLLAYLRRRARWTERLQKAVVDRTAELESANVSLRDESDGCDRAVHALRRSETDYRLLVENLHEGVWALDESMGTTFANQRMAGMLGYSPEEMIGRTPSEFADERNREEIERRFRVCGQGVSQEFELEFRRRDGRMLKVLVAQRPVRGDASGGIGAILGVMDITEAWRMAELLRQAGNQESIGQLAGGVAHDFNNLMSPILIYSEMIASSLAEDDLRRELAGTIREAAVRASHLARRLLTFGSNGATRIEPMDINETIVGTIKLLRRMIREEVEIHSDLAPCLEKILADRHQIEQILMNLAINASDAIDGVGRITIRTDTVWLDGSKAGEHDGIVPGTYIRLSFSDTGCGMGEATILRIFDPFFTTKASGRGTGLGLATVREIIREYGGTIRVRSEVGKGTWFEIYFKQQRGSPSPTPTREESASGSAAEGPERILVVEDDPMVRRLILQVLQSHRYQVVAMDCAQEALESVIDGTVRPQLLLTDVIMPGMNGKQLHERLVESIGELKVIYISGHSEQVLAEHGIAWELGCLMQKPFEIGALLGLVRSTLDARPAIDPNEASAGG